MNNKILILGAVMAALMFAENSAEAQLLRRRAPAAVYGGRAMDGLTQVYDVGRVPIPQSVKMGLKNPYSPRPIYTYSNPGIESGLIHQWNQQEEPQRPWHGSHSHWRYDEPTALVVPPTAAYHSSYAWGVGQVRSTPIHHQFGREGGGMIGGGEGMFSRTPYWPSSTDQFGVYPVRAPWSADQ